MERTADMGVRTKGEPAWKLNLKAPVLVEIEMYGLLPPPAEGRSGGGHCF